MHPQKSFGKATLAYRGENNVVAFKAGDPDSRRNFDPGCPVPARIAELKAAVMDGTIKAQYVKIAIYILQLLKPDRDGNWRIIKPLTHPLIAEKFGCSERTLRTALCALKRRFEWFNWRKVEDGTVFKMGPDGCMIGKMVARSGSDQSQPKENQEGSLPIKEKNYSRSRLERKPATEPASIRLARWRATLPEAVVDQGIAIGMKKRRLVLAVADRFVNWYGTTHPERAPADLTAKFLDWLRWDAERMAAKQRARQIIPDDIDVDIDGMDNVVRLRPRRRDVDQGGPRRCIAFSIAEMEMLTYPASSSGARP